MRNDFKKWTVTLGIVALTAFLGVWLARDVTSPGKTDNREPSSRPRVFHQTDAPNPARKSSRPPGKGPVNLRDLLLGTPNERIVRFKSDQAYRDFLAKLDGSKLRLLGQLDPLRALRIGFDDLDDLNDLLGDEDDAFANYLVAIPELPQVDAQPGAVGFGRSTLEWLGVTGDNSAWGDGVVIAMLDTGVSPATAFSTEVREIDLVTTDQPVPLHGHGTAVASLLIGVDNLTQGLAPSADLLSIRIGDETGSSNSFLLAQGIVTAVDQGAQLVNISMGSYGDSALVRDAVNYANDNGVLIVAAAGNEGFDSPAYPAAYEGVIAVGAIDANGQHLDFSNTGENLGLTAPGYQIAAAWPGDNLTGFSGTSASAPIATGAIAAAASEFSLVPSTSAAALVIDNLNAAGPPGDDPYYGEGIVDVGRVMNSETAGIYDGAIASNHYVGPTEEEPSGQLFVTVENRGTEPLTNTQVNVTVSGGTFALTVPNLIPGATQVLTLPVNPPTSAESVTVQSTLTLGNGLNDIRPDNDTLGGEIVLVAPDPAAP